MVHVEVAIFLTCSHAKNLTENILIGGVVVSLFEDDGEVRERYCNEQETFTHCDGKCSTCGIWEWIEKNQ